MVETMNTLKLGLSDDSDTTEFHNKEFVAKCIIIFSINLNLVDVLKSFSEAAEYIVEWTQVLKKNPTVINTN
jgi:hypothetical protein